MFQLVLHFLFLYSAFALNCDQTSVCDDALMTCQSGYTCQVETGNSTGICCEIGTATDTVITSATVSPVASCVDSKGPNGSSDCHQVSHLCGDPVYYDVMTAQCPKTCNRCDQAKPTTVKPGCHDNHYADRPSDCPNRKHLCNDSVYREVMDKECPVTCGRCNSTSSTTRASY